MSPFPTRLPLLLASLFATAPSSLVGAEEGAPAPPSPRDRLVACERMREERVPDVAALGDLWLKDEDGRVRACAADALERIPAPQLRPLCLSAIAPSQPVDVRRQGAQFLRKVAEPASAPLLEETVRGELDEEVRHHLLAALVEATAFSGDRSPLHRLLEDPRDTLREAALRALARTPVTADLPVLIRLVTAGGEREVDRAAAALRRLGDPLAAPALRAAALTTPNPKLAEELEETAMRLEAGRRR